MRWSLLAESDVTLDVAPTIAPGAAFSLVGDELVVLSEQERYCLVLNPLASMLYPLFDGNVTLAVLAADVVDVFDAPVEEAGRDLVELVSALHQRGLVTLSDSAPREWAKRQEPDRCAPDGKSLAAPPER